jgi:hypothetical protein
MIGQKALFELLLRSIDAGLFDRDFILVLE